MAAGSDEGPPFVHGKRRRRAIQIDVRERAQRPRVERRRRAPVGTGHPRQRPGVLGLTRNLLAEARQLDAGQPGERGRARQLDRPQARSEPRPLRRADLTPQLA
jgi:hypothetical protein